MRYWLIKSEPDVFSIDDLKKVKREPWSGVRNYQARNSMRDDMKAGDLALFYHSSVVPPGVAGVARVVGESYPDPTQFDSKSEYFDATSPKDNPRWILVDFEFVAKFDELVTLQKLKEEAALDGMAVLQKGTRLSVTPVDAKHFKHVCKLAGWKP